MRGVRWADALGSTLASLQRIVGPLIEPLYFLTVDALFADLEKCTDQCLCGKLLHRETNGIRRALKPLIAGGPMPGSVHPTGKELCLSCEIEGVHDQWAPMSSQRRPHKADRRWNRLRKQKLPRPFLCARIRAFPEGTLIE